MLNPDSLLLFPDLGSTDPKFHDQLNSSVERFILQFRQSGYCVIALPSGTYQPRRRQQQPTIWTRFYEGEWDPFHQSFVRGKLSNLVNHMFLLAGRNVSSSKWAVTRQEYNNFKGRLKYQTPCCKCFRRYCLEIWVDLRLCPISDTMWLNVHAKFPQPPADPAADLCNECFNLTIHENPEPPVSEDQSKVRECSFRLKEERNGTETLILQFMHDGEETSGDESETSNRTLRYDLDSSDSDRETRDTSPEAVP